MIIGFGGRAGSGKDTAFRAIYDLRPRSQVIRLAFGDFLKEEVASALGITVQEIEHDKARFRPILQWWGTEWRRGQDPDYWVKQMNLCLREWVTLSRNGASDLIICVTDVRFQNEAKALREYGAKLVRVVRPHVVTLTPIQQKHQSEVDLSDKDFDYHLCNDIDELGEFAWKVQSMLSSFGM